MDGGGANSLKPRGDAVINPALMMNHQKRPNLLNRCDQELPNSTKLIKKDLKQPKPIIRNEQQQPESIND